MEQINNNQPRKIKIKASELLTNLNIAMIDIIFAAKEVSFIFKL